VEGRKGRYAVIPSEGEARVEESSAVSGTPFTGTATARFLDSLRSLGMTGGGYARSE